MTYLAGWNMPGYLPETDPVEFDDIDEATQYIRDELHAVIEQDPLSDHISQTEWQAARALDELDPNNEMSWWTPGTPFESNLVGDYIYWTVQHG